MNIFCLAQLQGPIILTALCCYFGTPAEQFYIVNKVSLKQWKHVLLEQTLIAQHKIQAKWHRPCIDWFPINHTFTKSLPPGLIFSLERRAQFQQKGSETKKGKRHYYPRSLSPDNSRSLFTHWHAFPLTPGTWDGPTNILSTKSVSNKACLLINTPGYFTLPFLRMSGSNWAFLFLDRSQVTPTVEPHGKL